VISIVFFKNGLTNFCEQKLLFQCWSSGHLVISFSVCDSSSRLRQQYQPAVKHAEDAKLLQTGTDAGGGLRKPATSLSADSVIHAALRHIITSLFQNQQNESLSSLKDSFHVTSEQLNHEINSIINWVDSHNLRYYDALIGKSLRMFSRIIWIYLHSRSVQNT
jgi:hypothetical protein